MGGNIFHSKEGTSNFTIWLFWHAGYQVGIPAGQDFPPLIGRFGDSGNEITRMFKWFPRRYAQKVASDFRSASRRIVSRIAIARDSLNPSIRRMRRVCIIKLPHQNIQLRCPPTISIVYLKASWQDFFFAGSCMAQRGSLSGRSPFCQLNVVKKNHQRWSWDSTSSACYVTTQKLARNTGQTAEKEEDSLTEGVKSNSIGENLLVPSDQGTLWRAKRQETEITHVRWCSQVFLDKKNHTTTQRKKASWQDTNELQPSCRVPVGRLYAHQVGQPKSLSAWKAPHHRCCSCLRLAFFAVGIASISQLPRWTAC